MADETYSRAKAEMALLKAVNADPRVIAAREALDLFNLSADGQTLANLRGRKAWAEASEELKETYEAFGWNWARSRKAVKEELRPRFIRAEVTA